MNALVIADSPAKAKTLTQCLGDTAITYTVLATQGAVRELKGKDGDIDVDQHFQIRFQLVNKNKKYLEAIVVAIESAEVIYLATNPGRAGEASAWQLLEAIRNFSATAQSRLETLLHKKHVKRVDFHELSKAAVTAALDNARNICMPRVHAHHTELAINHLYQQHLAGLLGAKIRHGLRISRLQSAALCIIARQEKKIRQFQAKEYWLVRAELCAKKQEFTAQLTHYQNTTLSQYSVDSKDIADAIETTLRILAKGHLTVLDSKKSQQTLLPPLPFITATLQQAASRKLNFTPLRTARVAQQLFEGIDLGETISESGINQQPMGYCGLISFMHSDCTYLPEKTTSQIRDLIAKKYGKAYLSAFAETDCVTTSKPKSSGTAIYPLDAHVLPDQIKSRLTADQYKLYKLIWERSIASQMAPEVTDKIELQLDAVQGIFVISSKIMTSSGFNIIYLPDRSNKEAKNDLLPLLLKLKRGDKIKLKKIDSRQYFSKPPSRFRIADILEQLDKNQIAQPWDYATAIANLHQQEYIEMDKQHYYPTDIGQVMAKLLDEHFSPYVDPQSIARLNQKLDAVSQGNSDQLSLIQAFWQPFSHLIREKNQSLKKKDITQKTIEEKCPQCHAPLSIRLGRRGYFIGCSTYPICDYTRNLSENGEEPQTEIIEGRSCPNCQSALILKQGKYGKFIGCSTYPSCKHMEPLNTPENSGVKCPLCAKGTILKRKSHAGKTFYSCSRYPNCKYAIWNPPLAENCPDCDWPILSIKTTKRKGKEKHCPQKSCRFSQPYETT